MAKNRLSFDAADDIRFENTRVNELSGEKRTDNQGVLLIKASHIVPSPFNQGLELQNINELVDSLRETGLLEPIILYKLDNGKYELLSGHRRLHAWCNILGNKEIKAYVMPYEKDIRKRFEAHTQANTATRQKDLQFWLSRIEQARRVLKETGFTGSKQEENIEVSKMLNGISKSQLYRYEGFLKLIPELKQFETKGYLSANTLYMAVGLDNAQQKDVVKSVNLLQMQKAASNPENWDDAEISREEFQKIVGEVRKKKKKESGNEPAKKKSSSYIEKVGKSYEGLTRLLASPVTKEEKSVALNYITMLREMIDAIEKSLGDQ